MWWCAMSLVWDFSESCTPVTSRGCSPIITTRSIAKVLTGVHENFWQKWHRNFGSPKKMINYSTQKSVKWGVYLLWGFFDLENGSFGSCAPTKSIANFLLGVHKKFGKMNVRIPDHQKRWWTVAHKNWQNKGCTCLEAFWPWKWIVLTVWAN